MNGIMVKGTATWGSGHGGRGLMVYTGEFQGRERHGYGTMVYEDGSEYEGQWRRGRRNGHGG